MRLKLNDTDKYNLTLDLEVDYKNEQITVVIVLWDKKQHKTRTLEYAASEFDQALETYRQMEKTYFCS